jgi:hypothetical protein
MTSLLERIATAQDDERRADLRTLNQQIARTDEVVRRLRSKRDALLDTYGDREATKCLDKIADELIDEDGGNDSLHPFSQPNPIDDARSAEELADAVRVLEHEHLRNQLPRP